MNEYKIELDGKIYLFGEETKRKIIKIKKYAFFINLNNFIWIISCIIFICIIIFFLCEKKLTESSFVYLSPLLIVIFITVDVDIFIYSFVDTLVKQIMQDFFIIEGKKEIFFLGKKTRKIRSQIMKNKITKNEYK